MVGPYNTLEFLYYTLSPGPRSRNYLQSKKKLGEINDFDDTYISHEFFTNN